MATRFNPCSVQGCNGNARKRGWCSKHYQRWRAHGDPEGGGAYKGEALQWVIDRVNYDGDDCIRWPFATYSRGDSHINFNGKHWVASRLLCFLAHGAPPTPEHEAAHNCGNGHLGCMNPKHLQWKTRAENNADKLIHGTHDRGERQYGAVLTESDVIEIRSLRGRVPQKRLAERFGVTTSHICGIQVGREWAWLPMEPVKVRGRA